MFLLTSGTKFIDIIFFLCIESLKYTHKLYELASFSLDMHTTENVV